MKRKNMTWKELEVEKKFQAEKKAEIKEAVKMLVFAVMTAAVILPAVIQIVY